MKYYEIISCGQNTKVGAKNESNFYISLLRSFPFKNFFYYAGNIVLLFILHIGLSSLPATVVYAPRVSPMCAKIINI